MGKQRSALEFRGASAITFHHNDVLASYPTAIVLRFLTAIRNDEKFIQGKRHSTIADHFVFN